MTRASINQLRHLPVRDRIELVDELIHSIGLDQGRIPVTTRQKAMIDERLENIARHVGGGISLAAFRKEARGEARSLRTRSRRKSA